MKEKTRILASGEEYEVLLGRDCINIIHCCDCGLRHINQYYLRNVSTKINYPEFLFFHIYNLA